MFLFVYLATTQSLLPGNNEIIDLNKTKLMEMTGKTLCT